MKTILSIVITVLCSATAFASENTQVQSIQFAGHDATVLTDTLVGAGSYFDCGGGVCGTTAAELSCTKMKFEKNGSACTLKVQDELGRLVAKRLTGKRAEKLVNLLIDAEVVNCAMESCEGKAESIDCTVANDPGAGEESSQCSIEVK
jgi:hypothetical protein